MRRIVRTLGGPERLMGGELYETDASTPELEQLSATATAAWSEPVASLFGGTGFNPNDGWVFNPVGSLDVGSIAPTNQGHSDGLDGSKTVGVSIASGSLTWTILGDYECEGALSFLNTAFVCAYSGSTPKSKPDTVEPTLNGLSMDIEGFNPSTGSVSWKVPVRNVQALTYGTAQFLDGTRILIRQTNGRWAVLNTQSGTTTPETKGEIFWCTKYKEFKVNENKQTNPHGMRVATIYFPCTSTGQRTANLPATSPSNIGVTVDGVYMWASPQGLSSRVVGADQGEA
jgi:hypothetical protein